MLQSYKNFTWLKPKSGFTLVELLVSISIFVIVTTIAVGGFVTALRSQRQATGLIAANSNASLVIEQMAREIRTGDSFCVGGQTCLSSSELSFRNGAGNIVTYRLNGAEGGIERRVDSGAFQKITADNVNVRYLGFTLLGQDPGDGLQPRVTMVLGVSARVSGVEGGVIALETTVSSRQPDS